MKSSIAAPFLQELGVGADPEGDLGLRHDRSAHPLGSPNGHGGLGHHHLGSVHVTADGTGDRQHVLEVGGAVLVRRGANRDEYDLGPFDRGAHIGREAQPFLGLIAADQSPRRPGS